MRKTATSAVIVFCAFLLMQIVFAEGNASSSGSADDLKSTIQSKAKELEALNKEINQVGANLSETKTKSKGLTQDINTLDTNIRQLDLKTRAGTITVEKLKLELQDLGYSINEAEASIKDKKDGVASSLRVLQRLDADNLLVVLLRSGSLSESATEAQNLFDLNNSLSASVAQLQIIQDSLNEKLNITKDKKSAIETETERAKDLQIITRDQKAERQKLLSLTKAEQKSYEQQLSDLAEKQKKVANEIGDLEAALRLKIDPNALPAARPGVLLFPVPGGRFTQGYGRTAFAVATYGNQYHNGVDIGKAMGAEIIAPADGVIVSAGNQDLSCPRVGYGKYIVIKHTNGLTTLYGHLSRYIVTVGTSVKRGETVAYMGKTGWATGPHLHFVVYASNTYQLRQSKFCGLMPSGGDLDPNIYLDPPT